MKKGGWKRNLTGLILVAVLVSSIISTSALGEEASTNPADQYDVVGNGISLEFFGTIDRKNSIVYPVEGTDFLIRKAENGNYELIDLNGTPVTEAVYSSDFSFSDWGYIIGHESTDGFNTEGLLSTDGIVLVPFQYLEINIYSSEWAVGIIASEATGDRYDIQSWDGLFLIEMADIYYLGGEEPDLVASLARDQYLDSYAWGDYINIQDRMTNEITTYDPTFTAVQTGASSIHSFDGLPGRDYNHIFNGNGDYILFQDENGRQGVTDLDGNVLIPADYEWVFGVYRGLAEVSDGNKCGILDANGVVVPVEYDSIQINSYAPIVGKETNSYDANGYFAVIQDGKLGYVKWGGEVTLIPTYSRNVMYIQGAAALMSNSDGTQSLLVADGTETLLPEEYSYVSALDYASGMLWEARTGEEYGYVLLDWHGEQLLSGKYESLDMTGDGQYLIAMPDYLDDTQIYIYHVVYGEAKDATRDEAEEVNEEIAETEEIESVGETEEVLSDEENQQAEDMPDSVEESREAVNMLDSAYSLLSEDFERAQGAAEILLTQAAELIENTYPEASSIIKSADLLLESDNPDFGTIGILIESARDMLLDEEGLESANDMEEDAEEGDEEGSEEWNYIEVMEYYLDFISSLTDNEIETYKASDDPATALVALNWSKIKPEIGNFKDVAEITDITVSDDGSAGSFTGIVEYDGVSEDMNVYVTISYVSDYSLDYDQYVMTMTNIEWSVDG